MQFDTEVVARIKCDGPGCDSIDNQPIRGEYDHSQRLPAKPSTPKGWYVVQQDGTRVFCSVSCIREWLGHWTAYRGGDADPNASAIELRDFFFSLRENHRGSCRVHGRGCEYNHGL